LGLQNEAKLKLKYTLETELTKVGRCYMLILTFFYNCLENILKSHEEIVEFVDLGVCRSTQLIPPHRLELSISKIGFAKIDN